jgi:maltose/moltooligosaccharide transporter
MGYIFPIFFTWIGIANEANVGEIPDTVKYSFYTGAAILILCVLYTFFKVKEMPPKEYAEFHGIDLQARNTQKSEGLITLLKKAPETFWTVGLVQFFCWAAFLYMWNYTNGAIALNCWGVNAAVEGATASAEYQAAGNWVGVLFAVQAVGSIVWATIIPRFKNIRTAYVVSLLIGAVGFASVMFIHNQWALFVSYFLIGFAWAAMLALPFTLLTNALEGSPYMGSYLGLFNCTICLPQIIAAATGGAVLRMVGDSQPAMLLMAGIYLVMGACCVYFINTKKSNKLTINN